MIFKITKILLNLNKNYINTIILQLNGNSLLLNSYIFIIIKIYKTFKQNYNNFLLIKEFTKCY